MNRRFPPASDIDGDGYNNEGHDRTGNSRGHDDAPQGPGRHRARTNGDNDGHDRTGDFRGHDAPQGPGRHRARANGNKHDLDPAEEFHGDEPDNAIDKELGWFDFDNLQEIDSDIQFSKAQAKSNSSMPLNMERTLRSSSAAFRPESRRSATE